MIDRMLPSYVRVAESFDDVSIELYPAEAVVVERAVDKRRREFGTVRACARAALQALGAPVVPLVPGAGGPPSWPSGVVGSMTHCDGYRAAAVARHRRVAALGIDAEPNQPLPPDVLNVIARPGEAERLPVSSHTQVDAPAWDRLLFCVKEAVFKAWFPVVRRYLSHDDIVVQVAADGTYTAELLAGGLPVGSEEMTVVCGRWLAFDGFLAASLVVPVAAPRYSAIGHRAESLPGWRRR